MAVNKKYVFVQRGIDDFSCIKITEGEFKDVIFTYGHVKFAEKENEQGKIPLKFDYKIQRNYENKDTDGQEFKNLIGDILVEVVELQLKEGKLNIKD
jgi:hypothetical protein|tara:strand:+ start:318 stop:608 length:291 start_codon:yes stop_codon:yes gene_type:complete